MSLAELQLDVQELELLESQVKRQRVKNIISVEINKLHTEISKIQQQTETPKPQTVIASSTSAKRYQIKLTNYAWDQSQKFVKFYVTLKNVQTLPPENISCKFTNRSLELNVVNLDNKDYLFILNNLLMNINPEESTWKVKSDMILINAAKVEQNNWGFVTETEKRTSDAKKPPTMDTEKSDPTEGLMSLMKNMYDQGDDDLKRTIAQAWHDSHTKNPGF